MKRLMIGLLIIAMLGVIYPGLPLLAQPTLLPHENPATATGLLDGAGLLLTYSRIIDLATDSQYRDARDILNELKHADIPDEVRYIVDRYNALCQRLFSTLDNLETQLDEVADLLDRNQVREVRQRLDNTEADIQSAYTLLEDIEAATDSLGDILGVFAAIAVSQLTQANMRLEESLKKLADLIDRLNNLNRSLTEQYVKKLELNPTELSLDIRPAAAYVGDAIIASGRLKSDGSPLPGKTLSLNLDDDTVATVITGNDGSYAASITLPYRYVENMTLFAIYEPAGDDAYIYLAGTSPPATVTTMFYRTKLEVSAIGKVYRGQPFTVSGTVTADHADVPRNIHVLLDGTGLAEATTTDSFSFEITLPEEVPPGARNLTVAVSPRRRYSGASVSRSINLSVLPVYIDIQTPTVVLLPGNIEVTGRAYSEIEPLAGARLHLGLDDASVITRTRADGSFKGVINMHLIPGEAPVTANPLRVSKSASSSGDFSPLGTHEITVTMATPGRHGTALSVERQIFTVNPLSTALMLAVFAALWLAIRRRSRLQIQPEKEIPPAVTVAIPAVTPPPAPVPRLTGIRGRVLSAYRSVLEVVEKITGVIMAPDITLREFLKMIRLTSPVAHERFAELTAIAETTLYSASSPRQDTAARVEELAADIKEELRRGTP